MPQKKQELAAEDKRLQHAFTEAFLDSIQPPEMKKPNVPLRGGVVSGIREPVSVDLRLYKKHLTELRITYEVIIGVLSFIYIKLCMTMISFLIDETKSTSLRLRVNIVKLFGSTKTFGYARNEVNVQNFGQ